MDTNPSREALGDWSGLKGTHYHLLYAIWLLLRGRVDHVAFYQGNDLLARPTVPPRANDNEEPISLRADTNDQDIWIQIKSTDTPWSPQRFLPSDTSSDNLLKNFICNAFESERKGRTWRVHLITQGPIRQLELKEFVARPATKRKLNKSLREIVKQSQQALLGGGYKRRTVTQKRIREVGLQVLAMLATCVPHPSEQLAAEAELEIAYACYNRDLARRVAEAFAGAMLDDAAKGPADAQTYDLAWLNHVAGFPIRPTDLFDQDPLAACAASIRRFQPPRWSEQHFVTRTRLENALSQFLQTDETLFVLLGGNGSGKSWATLGWCLKELQQLMRLFIPGYALLQSDSLAGLVARFIRPFTSAGDWSDELLFRRFQHAAYLNGGSFVIAIDDLLVPKDNVDLRQRLSSLVAGCGASNGKMLVTCQKNTWNLYDLGKAVPLSQIFTFDVAEDAFANISAAMPGDTKQARPSYSFSLEDLSDDEMDAIVAKRLASEHAPIISQLLKSEPFLPLRNAFLLNAFVDSQAENLVGGNLTVTSVAIDPLLDERIEKLIGEVASSMGYGGEDLLAAFDALVDTLWETRVAGLSYATAASLLSTFFPGDAGNLINELRRAGLLTSQGPIRLAEPRIADRLFAKRYERTSLTVAEIAHELSPEVDGGVVAALMRGSVRDPIVLGEMLLRNKRWIKAVSDGIAQCPADDYRVIAFANSIMRSDPEHILVTDGGDALGQLAVRDERAWRWLIGMYFGRQPSDRYQGEYSLGVALEVNPRKTGAAVALKLKRAAKIRGALSSDEEKRANILRGALDPLRLIRSKKSAEIGRRLISKYGHLAGTDENNRNLDFLEEIERVRGRLAIYGTASDLDNILTELTSEDRISRYGAAIAIRDSAIEQPSRVQPELFNLFSREDEFAPTINRVLLAAYAFVSAAPDALVRALAGSPLTNWTQPKLSTGQVLALLADLSPTHSAEIYALLPTELTKYPAEGRAFLSEMLSYAWWRCSERIPEATTNLESLCALNLDGIPVGYRSFAIRGAAVAQLGRICLAGEFADDLAGEQFFYPYWDLRFAYLNTREFMRKRADEIVAHEAYPELRNTLVQAVAAEDYTDIYSLNRPLRAAVFRSTVLCLEMLTSLAAVSLDPLRTLELLPRDWRGLNLASGLLEAGVVEENVLNFTRQLCEDVTHGPTTFQAYAERERCLALMAALDQDPLAALEHYRTTIGDRFFESGGTAAALARLMDKYPHSSLRLLDQSVRDSSDLATIYHLKEEVRSWRGLLLAGVYQRMFYRTPISIQEAKELCRQVLSAVSAVDENRYQQEYGLVYESILASLNGAPPPTSLPSLPDSSSSLLARSHALALSVLRSGSEPESQGSALTSLNNMLADRRGWITSNRTFDGDAISDWSWAFLNYVYPAVRLASVAIGQAMGLSDPAARLLDERRVVSDLLATHKHAFRDPSEEPQPWVAERLERAVIAFQDQLTRTPNDELLQSWLGDALLRLGRFNDAEEALSHAMSLQSCGPTERASALYNLACVKARQGLKEDCRKCLEESSSLRELNSQHTAADPDLESVRSEQWFIELLSNES